MVGAIPSPKEQVIPERENLFKAVLLIALVAASFYGADRIADVLETPFKWLLVALLGIVDVMLLTGMGVLAHDAVHRVLFRSHFWNELWGGLLSAQDAAFLAVAAALYFLVLPALGISLVATVLPLILAFPLVFAFRALSDHYGLPPVASEANEHEKVTGWVVLTSPWLEWLWSHINYHEVHHRYPYLSHCYLPRVFAATRDRHPYFVVRGYWRSLLNLRKRSYYMFG